MKLKYYLRGCGLGILLTVIVFTVALHNRGGVMTDEKALARAAELGMVMPDSESESTQGLQFSTEPVTETESESGTEALSSTESFDEKTE